MLTRKPSRCKHCRERLERIGEVLHQACIEPWLAAQKVKKQAKEAREQRARAKVERAKDKARRRALDTIPQLIKIAQKEFNAYIRERDKQAGHRCISSGRVLDWSGNGVDAGHYRSVGAAPHLRFDERNCHAQSKHDNQYRAGNAVDYRIGLIRRIGLGQIEALEADNRIHHWTHEELRSIAAEYRAKTRALKERA